MDMQAYVAISSDIISIELYDPATLSISHRKKKDLEEWRHLTTRKKISSKGVGVDVDGRRLAQAGDCYRQKRRLGGRVVEIRTQFTLVDKEFNAANKRSFVTCCSFSDYTVTSTYVVERLLQAGDKPSSSISTAPTKTNTSNGTNSNSPDDEVKYAGCRWTLSYAMLPNGWYGKFMIWRHRHQMEQDLRSLHALEFDSLGNDIRSRFYKLHSEKIAMDSLHGIGIVRFRRERQCATLVDGALFSKVML